MNTNGHQGRSIITLSMLFVFTLSISGSGGGGGTISPAVTLSGGMVILSENGGTNVFAVVLNAPPDADVPVTLTSSDSGEALIYNTLNPTPATRMF